MLAAACGKPPSPQGWSGARPVIVNGNGLVLVTHTGHLYALGGQTKADITPNYAWQFPPTDQSIYPLSEVAQQDLGAAIDKLSGVDAAGKTQLKKLAASVRLSGPTAKAFKDGVTATAAPQADRNALNSSFDAILAFEKGALGRIQAFYGEIGLSADGKTAYIGSFKGTIFALDVATGYTRWVQDAGSGIVGGIAVDGSTLYFGTKGKQLYAVDATTGAQKWHFNARGEIWATPTVDAGTIYFTSLDGSVYALDGSGKQIWAFGGASAGIASRPVVADGVVYAGAFDNKLYAINASDGSMRWTLDAGNWFWASAVVQNGIVYAASLDGKVYAVDAKTGQSRWSTPFDAGAPVRATPVIAGGGLVVAARDGRVYKLDLTTGKATLGPVLLASGSTVLADLATNTDGSAIYVVPTSKTLFVLDDQLTFKSVQLP
ncbi:MAG TPA: PQQ-binding-like beta-propeller repeat protein [Dehalococcoidia bacterium]|nr:PQQ-binding-like beta-propeller repeat protein [Dehalococcoidia bacterium]